MNEPYKIIVDDNGTGAFAHWMVIETETSSVIKRDLSFKDARALAAHLKGGGGFAGTTPDFFVKNVIERNTK